MSLTSFLKKKQVRARFRQEFDKPKFAVKRDLLAPPLTNHYSLVGTAFDYLMRFYLKRLNPSAVTRRWVAELAIAHPMSPLLTEVVINGDTGELSFAETDLTRRVRRIIEQAKEVYSDYLVTGELTDEVIETTLLLAQLDPIIRRGVVGNDIGAITREDVADLRNLITLVDPNVFTARKVCLLNPTFGEGSRLVGGADADLLIDDTLIDIKTTKKLELKRDYFDQLMGYYALYTIAGIDGPTPTPEIKKVAIYFSRYAYLYVIDLHDVVDEMTFPIFAQWFKEQATKQMA